MLELQKIKVPPLVRDGPDKVKNSKLSFNAMLSGLGLLHAAYGLNGQNASPNQEAAISYLLLRWTEGDDEITTSIRTTFGEDGSAPGTLILQHLEQSFFAPVCNELTDPEDDLLAFPLWQIYEDEQGT